MDVTTLNKLFTWDQLGLVFDMCVNIGKGEGPHYLKIPKASGPEVEEVIDLLWDHSLIAKELFKSNPDGQVQYVYRIADLITMRQWMSILYESHVWFSDDPMEHKVRIISSTYDYKEIIKHFLDSTASEVIHKYAYGEEFHCKVKVSARRYDASADSEFQCTLSVYYDVGDISYMGGDLSTDR